MTDKHITRRSVVAAGAWSVPVIAVAAATPAAAASTTDEWAMTSAETSYVAGTGSFGVLFWVQGATEAELDATTWELTLNGEVWVPSLGPRNLDQGGGTWVVAFNGDWPFAPAEPVDGFEIAVNTTAHAPDGDKVFSAPTELDVL